MRVVQRNLVYAVGLPLRLCTEEVRRAAPRCAARRSVRGPQRKGRSIGSRLRARRSSLARNAALVEGHLLRLAAGAGLAAGRWEAGRC